MIYAASVAERADIEEVVNTLLKPLLEADGAGIEVERFDGETLVLRLRGTLVGDPGAPVIKERVIRPVIESALGEDVKIEYATALTPGNHDR